MNFKNSRNTRSKTKTAMVDKMLNPSVSVTKVKTKTEHEEANSLNVIRQFLPSEIGVDIHISNYPSVELEGGTLNKATNTVDKVDIK
jgi:hypothetical protein